jgi:putative ABC transport system substrate-binding protein
MISAAPIHDRHPEVPASSRASKDERPLSLPLAPRAAISGPPPFEARPKGLAPQGDGGSELLSAAVGMRRREFITLLGGAAAVWPQALLAQRMDRVRRIGILANEPWPPLDGLRDGLRGLGYIDGQNLNLLYRYAEGEAERFAPLVAELVQLPVDVIVTWGTPPSLAAKAATRAIPIIMTSGDPIAVGLVPGLAYPGGNVTGLSTLAAELEGKRLELMRELLPRFSRVAVLSNPTNPYCAVAVESARRGAMALGVQLDVVNVAGERELDGAFLTLNRMQPDAILVVADPFLASQQARIAAFLVKSRLPSIYTYREQVVAGGLISYATNYHELFRRVAVLTDRILKGAKPGDLPVEQPTKFELVINLKTAKAIGLEIPPMLLARADEVIE